MTAVTHDRWGPNGLAVEQIVRRVSQLTDGEMRRLASAWDAWTAPDPAEGPLDFGDTEPWQVANDRWNDAEDALDDAAAAAGRAEEVRAAGRAAWNAIPEDATPAVVGAERIHAAALAASCAASAAAAVDLAGTGGSFTLDHVNMLLAPWRAVVELVGEPVCECRR